MLTLKLRCVQLQSGALHNTAICFLFTGPTLQGLFSPLSVPDEARQVGIMIPSIERSPDLREGNVSRDPQTWQQNCSLLLASVSFHLNHETPPVTWETCVTEDTSTEEEAGSHGNQCPCDPSICSHWYSITVVSSAALVPRESSITPLVQVSVWPCTAQPRHYPGRSWSPDCPPQPIAQRCQGGARREKRKILETTGFTPTKMGSGAGECRDGIRLFSGLFLGGGVGPPAGVIAHPGSGSTSGPDPCCLRILGHIGVQVLP